MNRMRLLFLVAMLMASAAVAHGDSPQLYFGLLHSHTNFSDGKGTPDDAFQMARGAGLDFFAVTEHNHSRAAGDDGVYLTPAVYEDLKQSARENTQPGEFVAIYGQEYSTISSGNHVNIFFASEKCAVKSGHFRTLYESWLPEHPEAAFIQFNHPDFREDQRESTDEDERNNDYGIDDYGKEFDALVAASKDYVALIELIVGPAKGEATNKPHFNGYGEPDYLFYLNKGFRLAPSASQDNHKRTWGVSTHARMGVWADSLSEQGLKDAILARRCYASEDEDMVIQFTVNGAMMGSVTPIGDTPVANCRISFEDEGEPNAEYRVKLFYDDAIGGAPAAVIEDVSVEPGVTEVAFVHSSAAGGYYFAKVTQKRSEDADCDDDAWTAPIWIVDETSDEIVDNTDDPELDEIEWEDASDYVGQTVTVRGRIIRSFNYRNQILFFNYDPDYENTLSLIVFKQDFNNFGGAAALQARLVDKQVRVRGKVSLYRNERMQVKLSSPDQILSVENGE